MKVFISHSPKDAPLARTLAQALRREGLEPWLAENEILPGENWAERVSKALNECDAMVALITPASIPPSTVQWDMSFAIGNIAYRQRLIPVFVGEESEIPADAVPWILQRFPVLRLRRPEDVGELVSAITGLLAAAA